MENEIQPRDDNFKLSPQGFVTLPFNEEEFKEFVVGLLGKPQVIESRVDGAFSIDHGDLKSIYSLINQRITQQNEATLIQFNATIIFSDNSSVLLNGIEALLSYNEIKPVSSDEIHLTFQYLIRFQDKNVPEKQEINISIKASRHVMIEIEERAKSFAPNTKSFELKTRKRWRDGQIQYDIKHTARTWGADIDAMLRNHFENLIEPESKMKNFIRNYEQIIVFITGVLILGISIYFGEALEKQLLIKKIEEVKVFFTENPALNLNELSKQIEYLGSVEAGARYGLKTLMIFLGVIMCFLSFGILGRIIDYGKNSYILLTKQSEKRKIKLEKKYEKQWFKFFITIVISIACSIIANYLFLYFN